MRIKYYPVIAVALMLSATTVSKADKLLQVYSLDTEAAPVEYAIRTISKVTFASTNFSVLQGEEVAGVFELKNVSSIKFAESTAVQSVEQASAIVVTPNPVRDNLVIKGGEELYGSAVSIYSVTGANVMQLSSWQGEAINISHLPAGVYIINIQSETIKFVKL